MINAEKLALFLTLGQIANKKISEDVNVTNDIPLYLSNTINLAELLPDSVRDATKAAESYKLFFVFENYLREFVVAELSSKAKNEWWKIIPENIIDDIRKSETIENQKSWMAITGREKERLLTYSQLVAIMNALWKDYFAESVRDKSLIEEAKHISHLRNNICHMSVISDEEHARIKQVIRDWFRMVAP